MAYPVSDPVFASDATFSSGPESGSNMQQGLVPGLKFVGPYLNFLLNRLCAWIVLYVKDLHNQVEFLNKNYAFTGTWSITTLAVNTLTAINGVVFSSFLHTAGRVRITGGAGNEFEYGTARSYTIRRGMTGHGSAEAGVAWTEPGDPGSSDGFTYHQPIELPDGCEIKAWRALVQPEATAGTVTARLWRVSHTFGGSPAIDAGTGVGAADTTTGTALQEMGVSGLSEVVDNTNHYVLSFSDALTPGVSQIDMKILAYEIDVEILTLKGV
jgi:hypothetical protein